MDPYKFGFQLQTSRKMQYFIPMNLIIIVEVNRSHGQES